MGKLDRFVEMQQSLSQFKSGTLAVTVPQRSMKEFTIKNIAGINVVIAGAMSSNNKIRAQGKTYGDNVPTIVVFNDGDVEWAGTISWIAR